MKKRIVFRQGSKDRLISEIITNRIKIIIIADSEIKDSIEIGRVYETELKPMRNGNGYIAKQVKLITKDEISFIQSKDEINILINKKETGIKWKPEQSDEYIKKLIAEIKYYIKYNNIIIQGNEFDIFRQSLTAAINEMYDKYTRKIIKSYTKQKKERKIGVLC